MRIVVFIPARMGSSRFPGKPLAPIAGRPLIERVCCQALKARGVDQVVVATDEPRIAEAVRSFGGQAIMTDPAHACGSDRVAQAARLLNLEPNDIAVNLQGDQPLCPPQIIEDAIRPLTADPALGLATVAVRLDPEEADDPAKVKVVCDAQGFALYFSRSIIPHARDRGSRPPLLKHLGIYAFRVWSLEKFSRLKPGVLEEIEKLEQLRALERGLPIKVVLAGADSPAVDEPKDVALIEALLAERD